MTRQIYLIRHPPVAAEYRQLCYGSSDVPLGPEGMAQVESLAEQIAGLGSLTLLCHSGLQRTAVVAAAVAVRTGITATVDPRLRERCMGSWELRSWDDLHAETGNAMLKMIEEPDSWRPPGGETTAELAARVLAWFHDLPAAGTIVAISHGGPIAALRGQLANLPVVAWPALIPACGEIATPIVDTRPRMPT